MDLLVLGANGLLGSNVVRAGQQRGLAVSGTYHSTRPAFDIPTTQFDLSEYDSFEKILLEHDPDVVINCAAMTDVDGCETNSEQAHVLNGTAPGKLAEQCDMRGIKFFHVSTDYVFDGVARDPYDETTDTNPIQVYGESKLAGEQAVADAIDDPLMTRLSFVWGIHRSSGDLTGFPSWVRSQLQLGETVALFTDQWVTPTRASQAAETMLDLLASDATGFFHVACKSCVTPYEFGKILMDYTDYSEGSLAEESVDDIEREAIRPSYSCLDVDRVESVLGHPQPTLREDVAAVWDAVR